MENLPGWEYITASRLIHKKETLLYSLVVTPNGTNASYVDVFDGESSNDPQVGRFRCSATISEPFNWNPPLKLHRGLYLSFETNLSSVLVQSIALGV